MATRNGGPGDDNLIGTSERDILNGFGGNDTLNGGAGIDTLVGGIGNDTYIVDTTTDIIIENPNGGIDTVRASVSYTLDDNYLNNLTLTGSRAISGTGNSYNNIITGNDAANILDGRGGIDTLIGGRGNDTYIVDSTTDEIVENSGGGTDTVQSSVSYTLGAYVNNLTLTGTSAINGIGNSIDNVITGNNADNILIGEGGNDFLNADNSPNDFDTGGDGKDFLQGGAGNDSLRGDDLDTLYGGAGDDDMYGVTFYGNGPTYMYGGDGNDDLGGYGTAMYGENGNDTLSGDSSSLYGGDGNDVLYPGEGRADGGDGDDIINGSYANMTGGNGNDTITVGFGSNNVRFNAPTEGIDTITGFSVDDDFGNTTISVSASGFGGGLTAEAAITPEQFRIGTVAADASDRFIYNNANGALFFDPTGSTNGATDQVRFATLVGAPGITSNNIFVVND